MRDKNETNYQAEATQSEIGEEQIYESLQFYSMRDNSSRNSTNAGDINTGGIRAASSSDSSKENNHSEPSLNNHDESPISTMKLIGSNIKNKSAEKFEVRSKGGFFRNLTGKGADNSSTPEIARKLLSDTEFESWSTFPSDPSSISTGQENDDGKTENEINKNRLAWEAHVTSPMDYPASQQERNDKVVCEEKDFPLSVINSQQANDISELRKNVSDNDFFQTETNGGITKIKIAEERSDMQGNSKRYSKRYLEYCIAQAVEESSKKQHLELSQLKEERDKLLQQTENMKSEKDSLQKNFEVDLDAALKVQRANHDKETETIRKENKESMIRLQEAQSQLELQLSQLQQQAQLQTNLSESERLSQESILLQQTKNYELQLDDLRSQLLKQKETYEEQLQTQKGILTEEITTRITQSMTKKLEALEQQMSQMQTESETQISNIQNEHANEIEEMIAQLDEVEAEHERKLHDEILHVSSQKEIVITALSAHLAEERKKVEDMILEQERYREIIEETENTAQSYKVELEVCIREHEEILLEEKKNRRISEKKIEQDMRNAAEQQFNEANKIYLTLKREYDLVEEDNDRLTKEIKAVDSIVEGLKRESKNKEMEYMNEIAQLKAELATAQANQTRLDHEYSSEIESLKDSEQILKQKLEEATTNYTQVHMSLATVVSEKNKLEKENLELNSVCEELMAMVEGGDVGKEIS